MILSSPAFGSIAPTGTPVKFWSYGLTETQAAAHLQGYARTDPTLKTLSLRRDATTFYATTTYNRLDRLRMSNGWGINSHTVLRFDNAHGTELGRLVIDAVPDTSAGTGYTTYWYCDQATATTGAARTHHPGKGSLVYSTSTVHYQVSLGMLGRCGFAKGSRVLVVAGSGLFDTQYGKASGEWKSFISDKRYSFTY
ncbi:hypothetical protein [Nocardioides jiangxiensis]|uniref:Uncharacterized protein n=1 Tax=Nocardioides jiangxiensis TaxID=3064524 RepID=A0ABT9B0Y5_9ACTN|nr:hypothetical protein [Nocardioides sp. WY-20]MDO7868519.1 hypothetical protein [Nocardioides sp. WY-20]